MRAGQLRHLVSVQRTTESRSASGAVTNSWATLYSNVHARVNELSGLELIRAQRFDADVLYEVSMRYVADLRPKDRVIYGNDTLEIAAAINPDATRRETKLYCRKAVING